MKYWISRLFLKQLVKRTKWKNVNFKGLRSETKKGRVSRIFWRVKIHSKPFSWVKKRRSQKSQTSLKV